MNSAMVAGLLLALMVVSAARRRRDRIEWSRIEAAQRAGFGELMEALASLRSALIAAGAAAEPPGLPLGPPAPSFPPVRREVVSVTRDDDPIHTRATVEAPPPAAVPASAAQRWRRRADDLRDDATLASEGTDEGPTSDEVEEALRQAFHREADERDQRDGVPPPAPGGLAGALLERPVSDPRRTARAFAARTGEPSWVEKRTLPLGAERDRDTLTPTEPSVPSLDARIRRRWSELVAAAHEAGEEAAHCHGVTCRREGGGADRCACACEGCALVLELLVRAEREVRGGAN